MDDKQKDPSEKLEGKARSRPTIGLLLENTVGRGAYQADVWSGVADAVQAQGANLVCFAGGTLGNLHPKEFENTQNVVYDLADVNNVDGLIVSGTLGTFITPREFRNFVERFKPMPVVSTILSLPGIPSVIVDNEKGMREMLTHLIQFHGYRRLGFIRGPEHNPDAAQRYQVYKDVLDEHDIPLDDNLVVFGDFMLSSGATALDDLLKRAEPDVVIAANDNMALGALEALRWWDIIVPHELAVVGFDDMSGVKYITPPLTTVSYPAYEQGKQAAEMLLALLSGEKIPEQETLSTKARLRESCGCPDPTVQQARAGLGTRAERGIQTDLAAGQEKILAEVQDEVLADLDLDIEESRIKELLQAFYTEIQGQPTAGFLVILDEILLSVARIDGNVSDWHIAISSMRRHILPLISDDEVLFRAEDLWQQARVMISKRSRKEEGYKRLQTEQRVGKLNELAQELDTTSDLTELMNILAKGLKHLAIPGCYLSLYENPAAPTKQCRSILAYKSGKGPLHLSGDEQIFPADQLVPSGILSEEKPYKLIVEPLCYRENPLGMVVFEFDVEPYEGEVYETLRSQISSALWRVRLDRYLHALSEAGTHVMKLQEPDAILQEAVDQACKTLGALSTNIVLVNRNRELRRLIVGCDHDKSVRASKLMGEIVLDSIEKREPILVENMNNSDNPRIRRIAKVGLGAIGCFPLFLRGKLIGAMCIYYEKPHYFPAAEVNALKLYVNQTAIVYDNAKRMKDMEHLQQASQKLASVEDVRDVLQQIAESAHEVLEANSVAIWSYDASQKTFLPDELVTHGISPKLVEKSKLDRPSIGGTAETVMREGYLQVDDVDDLKYQYLGPQAHRLRGQIGVKSFQGIALKVGDELLGVLYVNYTVRQGFDDEEESTLKVFAHHAALALKKARLLKGMRRISDTARVVAEVSAQEDLQSTLKAIVDGTRDAFRCDAVTLNFYNSVTNQIGYPPALSGVEYTERVQRYTRGETRSIVYEMLQRTDPYIVEDVAENDNFKDRRFVKEEAIKSCVAVPLAAAGQKMGVIFVNYRTPHHFTGQEIEDIKLFAYQAAVAIRNAQLYDEATGKAKSLKTLYEAGKTVTSTLTLEEILKRIVEQAALLAARQGQQPIFCYLALKEGTKLKLQASYSTSRHVSRLVQRVRIIDLEGDKRIGIIGRAVKTGRSQLVLDVTQDPDYIPNKRETKSVLAVPISIGEEVLGVIAIGHSSDGAFDDEDRVSLESLSTQAALAIRNAQLYDQASRKAQYLQSLYQAGTAVTGTLTLDEILNRIAEQASLLTAYKGQQPIFCNLALKEGNVLKFEVSYSANHAPSLVQKGYVIDLEGDQRIGIVGRVARTGKSQLVIDVTKDPDYIPGNSATRSILAVPILIGEDVAGVIVVGHSNQSAFAVEGLECLELLSTQAASAMRNAQLYSDATRKTQYLQALYDAGKAVTGTLALDEILKEIVKQASQLTQNINSEEARFCYLALKENNLLKFKASYTSRHVSNLSSMEQEYIIDLERDERTGIVGRAVKTGKSQLVHDVTTDPDYIAFDRETRSLLAVPIIVGKDVVGVIVVEHSNYNVFGEEDRACLESLSTQAGLAIRNAHLYDEATREAQHLQALYKAGKVVTGTLALDEILKHIVEQASLLTMHEGEQAHFCHLALHQDQKLRFRAVYPPDYKSQLTAEEYRIDLKRDEHVGVVGRAVKTGKSCLVPDVSKDPDYIVGNPKTQSELAVPIIIGEEVVGVIGIEHSSYNAFNAEDQNFLESLATQAALAIRNAQLYDEATREARHLQALYEAGTAVTSTLSLNEILERIVEQVRLITGSGEKPAYLVHLGLLKGAELRIQVWQSDDSQGSLDVTSINLEQDEFIGIMGQAAKTGNSILKKDVTTDKDYLMYDSRTRSELAVPIKLGEKVIGVINVEHPDYGVFDRADQQSLETLATHVATAIQNAQAYEDLRRAQGLIAGRTALAWMGMTSSVWSHSANKHALVIRETAQLLRGDGERNGWLAQDRKAQERISDIETLATEILAKSTTLPLSSESGLKKVSVNALFGERAKQLWKNAPYKVVNLTLNLTLPESAIVRANPQWLQHAFDMLIDNAVKAVSNRKAREIGIGTRPAINGGVEIVVSDNGPGIPDEIAEKIGLGKVEKPADAEGLGMGLLIAQTVVQTYGGNIWVDTTGSTGTTIVISLPLIDQ